MSKAEARRFEKAQSLANGNKKAEGVAAMIALAIEGRNLTIRLWARQFLSVRFNIVFGDKVDAAKGKAGRVSR